MSGQGFGPLSHSPRDSEVILNPAPILWGLTAAFCSFMRFVSYRRL